jgi:hypothetical protein
VNLAEDKMERKQQHCKLHLLNASLFEQTNIPLDDQVVRAFENALALLKSL